MKQGWPLSALMVLAAFLLAASASWGYWQAQARLDAWLQSQRSLDPQSHPVSPQARQQLKVWAGRLALQPLKPEPWINLPGLIGHPDIHMQHVQPGRVVKASSVSSMQRDDMPVEVTAWVRHEEALQQWLEQLAAMPGVVELKRCTLTLAAGGGIDAACSLTASAVTVSP